MLDIKFKEIQILILEVDHFVNINIKAIMLKLKYFHNYILTVEIIKIPIKNKLKNSDYFTL